MFQLMQERTPDYWMYYMGNGMWVNDVNSAQKFETELDAQSVIDTLTRQAEWALKNMDYVPCTGRFKIIPI